MSKYAISHALIKGEIQIGRINKAGSMFLGDKEYHTDEAIYAVIQHLLKDMDGETTLIVGDKKYSIVATEEQGNDN